MNQYISLQRGINVGGQKSVRMVDLKSLYESLHLENVTSYVQSGNILFRSREQDQEKLKNLIEMGFENKFGFSTPVFIRSPFEFARIITENPYVNNRREDVKYLHVTFLYKPFAQTQVSELITPKGIGDEFMIGEKEIYLFCPGGYGKTKLSNQFFEKRTGQPVTTRNWNTVNALYKMAVME